MISFLAVKDNVIMVFFVPIAYRILGMTSGGDHGNTCEEGECL
jgi:hypothetical protein